MRIVLSADPELPVPPTGYGGIERIVAMLAEEFLRRGHEVGLVAHRESKAATTKLYSWPTTTSLGMTSIRQNTLHLSAAARDFRADVVHSFSRLVYLLPRLARRMGSTIMSYQRHTGGRALSVAAMLGGSSLAFTGCSEFICQLGRARGGSWHPIHNFVDVQRVTLAPPPPTDAPLLFLSRIEEIKGPHLAIAIARAAKRRLILAGNRVDSPQGRAFWDNNIAPELARGDVEWVGEVDDAEKWRLLGGASALLVPIQWDEPFGIVFVEALAAGVPVITCARGAAPEIIEPGKTGFFITGIDDGVRAIQALPSIDREACRARAESAFDVRLAATKYLDLYAQLQTTTEFA